MSRRRGNNTGNTGAVRGPSSALTSFLAGLGVEPSAPLTWGDNGSGSAGAGASESGPLAPDGPVLPTDQPLDPAGAVTARTVEAGPSTVNDKRKRSASIDSDDIDATAGETKKDVGEVMDCAECLKEFSVTAYTKEHPKKKGWLCLQCCYALGIDPFQKPKKAKAARAKPAERKKIVHYEERVGVPTLGEVCIGMIGKYIEDIEQLGDIGHVNMDKVCKIISRSRLLTPETALLFYSQDRTELDMYDCTRLVNESYQAMANLCPRLERINLHLTGQMSSESIKHWGEKLNLRRVELYGPFLVRQDGWQAFFRSTPTLEGFLITQSPRVDLETIQVMVQHCPIRELKLVETKVDDTFVPALSKLSLESLDLSSTLITDNGVEELLEAIGPNLVSLNLSHNDLSDRTAIAITKHCRKLERLYLSNVELDDQVVADMFKRIRGLTHVDMEKGHDLADAALQALIDGSADTLVELSILGWKDVSSQALSSLARCTRLRRLDVGWCRHFTDFTLNDILKSCPVERVGVWGCNQLTESAPRKRGVKVVGIETHAI